MKSIVYYIISLCFLNVTVAQAQIDESMTLAEARYQLEREMATIAYYYHKDYYGPEIENRFKYHKKFTDRLSYGFELLPADTITERMKKRNWKVRLYQTNRVNEPAFRISHNFGGERINKERIFITNSLKSETVFKEIFYYGSTENNPEVLASDSWYKNRKHIDSVLVDLTIYYPIKTKTVSISAKVPEKKKLGKSSYVALVASDDNFIDVAVTSDIVDNLASICGVTEDGTKYDYSKNTYTPKQPSTDMFVYANKCYNYYQKLIKKIDNNKYQSIKNLLVDFNKNEPTPPEIKWLYRYAFKANAEIKDLEFTYFTKYESITLDNVMAYEAIPRKCDYVVVEESTGKKIIRGIADKDGKWIIKPSEDHMIVSEVAGKFYKLNKQVDHTKKTDVLVYVDEKNKKFVETNYKLDRTINDIFLIVEKDLLFGVIDRDGEFVLPIVYKSIEYDKIKNQLTVTTTEDTSQVYEIDKKQLLPEKR